MMVHVQFRLDGHRRRVLDALADSTGSSRSELMREAVDLLLSQRGLTGGQPAIGVTGGLTPVVDLDGWHSPTAAGLPVVDDLDDIA
jgi:hypothetical protein